MRYAAPGFRTSDRGPATTLIEMTAKRWKAWMVISYALGWIGLALVGWQIWSGVYRPLIDGGLLPHTAGVYADAFVGPAGLAGFSLFAVTLGISVYARFMAWWHHG